jgi:acyl carrier protein
MKDIKLQVRHFLIENILMGSATIPIGDQTSLMENHVLDSTGFMELVAHLADTYNIKISDEELVPENLDSLANIERFVQGKAAVLPK